MPDLFLPVVIPFAFAVFRAITFFHGCLHLPENKRNSALLLQDAIGIIDRGHRESNPEMMLSSIIDHLPHKIRRRSA